MSTWNLDTLVSSLRAAWPTDVSESALRSMGSRGQVVRFKSDQVAAYQGDMPRGIHIVLTGMLDVTCVHPSGSEALISVIGPGEIHGIEYIFERSRCATSLVSRGCATLLFISLASLQHSVREYPELKDAVAVLMSRRTKWITDVLGLNSMSPSLARLAHRLIVQLDMMGISRPERSEDAVKPVLPLSQSSLASMLCMSRQSVHRLLHKLVGAGAISLRYGCIVINDLAHLERAARTCSLPYEGS